MTNNHTLIVFICRLLVPGMSFEYNAYNGYHGFLALINIVVEVHHPPP